MKKTNLIVAALVTSLIGTQVFAQTRGMNIGAARQTISSYMSGAVASQLGQYTSSPDSISTAIGGIETRTAIDIAQAIENLKAGKTPNGLDAREAEKAILGLLAANLLNAKANAPATTVQPVTEYDPAQNKALKDTLKALATGKATKFMAEGSAEGWSAESIKGLADFLNVFVESIANGATDTCMSSFKAKLDSHAKAKGIANGLSLAEQIRKLCGA